MVWLAFPLTAWGMLAVCRRLGIGPRTRWIAPALWCATPLVFRIACGQKTDLWMSLWVVGAFWAMARALGEKERPAQWGLWAACGVFCGLAASVRLLTAPLVASVLVIALARRGAGCRHRLVKAATTLCGMAAVVVLSGLGAHLLVNKAREGGFTGSDALRGHVSVRVPPARLLTHLGRLQFDLVDFPVAPPGARMLEWALVHASRSLGLERVLPHEGGDWPGRYEYFLPRRAIRLGIGGVLWTPLLAAVALAWFLRRRPRGAETAGRIPALAAITAASTAVAIAIAATLVWQQGFMLRFFIAAYAAVPLLAAGLCGGGIRRDAGLTAVIALQACVLLWGDVALGRNLLEGDRLVTSQFDAADRTLPADARVLLIAGQDARDYRIYAPDSGFSRQVCSAGSCPTVAAFTSSLSAAPPDFVLFQGTTPLSQLDGHPYDPSPLLRHLDSSGKWTSETLAGTHGQVLYRRSAQAGRPPEP